MTTKPSPSRPASPSRLIWRKFAIPLFFLLLGIVFATWAARIPAIRDHLQLDAATLALVLLCGGIGAVGSFPLAAWITGHYGARHSTLYAGLALLVSLPLLGLAPGLASLMLICTLYGAASSCFDVAINALGAQAERDAGRPIMSMLHGWFCVGTFSGALVASAVAGLGIAPVWHFLLVAALFLYPLYAAYVALPDDRPEHDPQRKLFAVPHGHLVVLGVIAFCGAIVEGSVADWSGIYMKDHIGASDGSTPLAYAAFAGMMLIMRMVGDSLKARYDARRVVWIGTLVASAGIALAVVAPGMAVAILGFAIAGTGVAAVFPFVFSAAGRHGSTALAAVATLGYSGSLIGPPVFGFLAHGWGLQAALALLGVLCLAMAGSSRRALWLQ
ncbi:major facilitator superfamily permease [Herbaspirillum frisingense GSF30]|uniref:Major facilitator superfamily permease n=1 Tax=Herbaspirillum frisingense GSF30 TaxID=864073 RepID=A0AAI9ICI9_9BURK|nr:MFS transporter [Herbaspirillum frisingense]EOA03571.1 major facilitator superfamily permease [Herbaspirillum frisingense GSF30]